MAIHRIPIPGPNRTQSARRQLHAGRNSRTLARLRVAENHNRQRARQPRNPAPPNQNVLDGEFTTFENEQELEQQYINNEDSEDTIGGLPAWVDLVEEEPDDIDVIIAEDREKHRQQAHNFNWNTLLNHLDAVYTRLRILTKNWASTNCYEDFVQCPSSCTKKYSRSVDLIDIHGQRREHITFCECTLDGVRLLQQGYLAGSPVRPQTAFSLPLLLFYNSLWNHCHIGAQPFTLALNHWLEPRSQRLCVRKGKKARQLRKPFSAAVDLFRKLEERRKKLITSALNLSSQEVLASVACPACFGPPPPNSSDYSATTRNRLIVCLDGNFQHRHQINASHSHLKLQTPQIFISQATVDTVSQEILDHEAQGMTAAQADRCTESHKAADDKRNESTWKGCDDTGLMGCCCRHDAAIYFANIYKSGEQRHFPMAIIKTLLSVIEPSRQVGILYDIGCTMDKYINRRHLIPQYRGQLTFGTSVFHAYVHNWLCQLEFHPRFNKGWGLSDGEGLERLWSYLSPLVSPLRYATRNHRLAAIAHKSIHHNDRGIKQLSLWLRKKFIKATQRQHEAQTVLGKLLRNRNPHQPSSGNFTVAFFQSQWRMQREFHATHSEAENDRQHKLVALYKREATVEHMRQRLQSPEIFLESVVEVQELMDSIILESESLTRQISLLTGRSGTATDRDYEEEKLRLLLWDAKSDLFVQAVQIHAERRPLLDAHIMGSRLGTQGKENIIKSLQNRRPAVKKKINAFNQLYEQFQQKYPDQQLSDSHHHPLTYDTFIKWGTDHTFWNDGLYYHTNTPWSTDPVVREGINSILVLGRVQEEFELLAQELSRTIGWSNARYLHIQETIEYIQRRIEVMKNNPSVAPDRFDELPLGSTSRLGKLELAKEELKLALIEHGQLIEVWTDDIAWLWRRCQPNSNHSQFEEWNALIEKVKQDQIIVFPHISANEPSSHNDMDESLEEAVLDVDLDDGEDAEEYCLSDV